MTSTFQAKFRPAVVIALALFGAILVCNPSKEALTTGLGNDPGSIALDYLRCLQHADYKGAYGLLAESERSQLGFDAYRAWVKGNQALYQHSEYAGSEVCGNESTKRSVKIDLRSTSKSVEGNAYAITIDLVKAADSKWYVLCGAEFISRAQSERVASTLSEFGGAWVNKDYSGMLARLGVTFCKSVLGKPPYDRQLIKWRESWETEHGPLRGISCTWRYVRYPDANRASVPAKFGCDPTGRGIPAYVPYLVELERDLRSGDWRITAMEQTRHYQLPPDVTTGGISVQRREAEEAAEKLGVEGVHGK